MSTCPLLRASIESRKATTSRRASSMRVSTGERHSVALSTLSARLAEGSGWRALQDLLNAIPDSNDDFSLF